MSQASCKRSILRILALIRLCFIARAPERGGCFGDFPLEKKIQGYRVCFEPLKDPFYILCNVSFPNSEMICGCSRK